MPPQLESKARIKINKLLEEAGGVSLMMKMVPPIFYWKIT